MAIKSSGMRWFLLFLCLPTVALAAENYRECASLAKSNPSVALSQADSEIQKHNRPADHHCRAMALFNLGRYSEAATALERLAVYVRQDNPLLWIQVLRQSARAYQKQQALSQAIVPMKKAVEWLALQPAYTNAPTVRLLVETLVEKAGIHVAKEETLLALQDLDHALSIVPSDEKALLSRARLLWKLQEYAAAKKDASELVRYYPGHKEGNELLRSMR